MYKLTSDDFTKDEDIELTAEEQAKEAAKKDEMEAAAKDYDAKMKEIMMEFFNDKVLPSGVPLTLLEEYFYNYFRASLTIYKTKSQEWKDYITAKEKLDLTPLDKLTII